MTFRSIALLNPFSGSTQSGLLGIPPTTFITTSTYHVPLIDNVFSTVLHRLSVLLKLLIVRSMNLKM
jgi:hypothetical protein